MNKIRKIDIHHHFIPKPYKKILERSSQIQIINKHWQLEDSLKLLYEENIKKAYLSIPFVPVYSNSIQEKEIVRACNESAAEVIQKYSKKFGAFASIPYMNIDNCLEEIEYSLDVLNLDGVILHSTVNNEIPYSDDLDVFYSEFEKRNTIVFVHPNISIKNQLLNSPAYQNSIEYYFDTARFIIAMIYNGILEKYQNIKYLLANGGGIVPFYSQRISRTFYLNGKRLRWGKIVKDMIMAKNSGQELLNNLYYETSTVLDIAFISALKIMVDSTHIIYGSNYGENLRNDLKTSVDEIIYKNIFNSSEAVDVFFLNAERLLSKGQKIAMEGGKLVTISKSGSIDKDGISVVLK